MAPEFRPARATDIRALAEIHAASWWQTYRGILPQDYLDGLRPDRLEEHWRRRLRGDLVPRSSWVVVVDHQVVGFSVIGGCRSDAELAGFAGEVYMLYLHPDRLGDGLGRFLLERSLGELERRGYYWSVIWVVKANRNARAFYEHLGFRCDTTSRWDEFHGRRVAVVRYAKALNVAVDLTALLQSPISD